MTGGEARQQVVDTLDAIAFSDIPTALERWEGPADKLPARDRSYVLTQLTHDDQDTSWCDHVVEFDLVINYQWTRLAATRILDDGDLVIRALAAVKSGSSGQIAEVTTTNSYTEELDERVKAHRAFTVRYRYATP